MPTNNRKTFTLTYGLRVDAVWVDVEIAPYVTGAEAGPYTTFRGLLDTGAVTSVVQPHVAEQIGLEKLRPVPTAVVGGGSVTMHRSIANLRLPGQTDFLGQRIMIGPIGDADIDILVGMDVINTLGIAVTGAGGPTKLSYESPSVNDVDFTAM